MMFYVLPVILVLTSLSVYAQFYMKQTTRINYDFNKSRVELKVHLGYKYLAYFLFILGLVSPTFILVMSDFDLTLWTLVFFFLMISVPLGWYVLLYQRNHSVVLSDETLVIRSALNQMETVRWSEVKSITLNQFLNMYVIKTTDSKYRVSEHLIGINQLFETAKVKGVQI